MDKIFLKQKISLDEIAQKIIFIKYILYGVVIFILTLYVNNRFNKIKQLLGIGILVSVYLIYVIFVKFYCIVLFKSYSYSLEEFGIIIQKGYLYKQKQFIPYNIIQNIMVKNNPVSNYFKYSNLEIHCIKDVYNINFIKCDYIDKLKEEILNNKNRYMFKF